MVENKIEEYANHYLRELRSGDRENALHSLIEADPSVVPLLIAEFHRDPDFAFRRELLVIVAEFMMPETASFFSERLYDGFWKTALDCLVKLSTPAAVQAMERARERKFDSEKQSADFRSWLDEAIEQAKQDGRSGSL